MPYHLATPQSWKKTGDRGDPDPLLWSGVGDGTRTHNTWNHNPVLCQLNYTHHMDAEYHADKSSHSRAGTPEGTRTPGLLLRRQLLYPTELLAHIDNAPEAEIPLNSLGSPSGTQAPAELLAHHGQLTGIERPPDCRLKSCGAGDENRTRIPSLEGWCPDHCATPASPSRGIVSLSMIA